MFFPLFFIIFILIYFIFNIIIICVPYNTCTCLPEFLKTGLAKKFNFSIISVINGPYLLEKKDLTNKSSSHMQHLLDDTKSTPQV